VSVTDAALYTVEAKHEPNDFSLYGEQCFRMDELSYDSDTMHYPQ
jgi:hypothetical protein